jgi:hypothetical protein
MEINENAEWECGRGCGFKGTYEDVRKHELAVALIEKMLQKDSGQG